MTSLRKHQAAAPVQRSQRRGFALMSVMIAVVLLVTGVMAIGAANTMRLRTQTQSTARTTSLNVARTYLENLRGRDPWSLSAEAAVRVNASGAVDPAGAYTRELFVTVERTNLLRIEVAVTGPGTSAPIRLMTNIYRGGTITPIL